MSDDPGGLHGLRAGHWLLIGLVVALVGAGVALVVTRGDGDPTAVEPTSAPVTSASVPSRPDCAPEITETFADARRFRFGFVYRSACDQVVRELRFLITVEDTTGNQAATVQETAVGGVLFPGTELATAYQLSAADKNMKIGRVTVEVTHYAVYPPDDFSAWAQTEVTGLTSTKVSSDGEINVTGRLEVRPPSAPVCLSEFVLVMRDRAGKIVYATAYTPPGGRPVPPEFPIGNPPTFDVARSTIYAPQTPRTEQPPRAGMTCNGS